MFNFFKKNDIRIFDKDTIFAPISGTIKRLEDVDDAIFSQKMMGDGIVIVPDSDTIFAPTDGELVALFPTGHAVAIKASNGVEYIIHIGIDTVKQKGKGFKILSNDHGNVQVGDKLVKLDLEYLNANCITDTIIVIQNSNDFEIEILQHGHIKALEPLIKITPRQH